MRLNPRGVVDALDGGQATPGGMAALTDLIFDPSTRFTFQCRPAAVPKSNFTIPNTPGVVSVAYQVGDICYGMIATSLNPGHDEPFAFNVTTNTLLTVGGTISAATTPLTPAATGDWTPPTMALMGIYLIVTHPGFGAAGVMFGWFDVTNPSSPTWDAGNTTTNLLPTVPTNVSQFNARAWFSVDNAVYATDALTLAISDASHIITINDSTPVTALAQLPLTTSVQGIIQSLAIFKKKTVALITGDFITNDLVLNTVSSSVGTSAPRTIAQTPEGLRFMDTDGIRILSQAGTLGEPYKDLRLPFIYALTVSRASAAYNNNIYRICVQNGNVTGQPFQEYWYDLVNGGWTGPHSFKQDMAIPYSNQFVIFNNTLPHELFVSQVSQDSTSSFTEDGEDMTFLWKTAPMQDNGGLYENSAILSVIDMEIPTNGEIFTLSASDVTHGVLSTATVQARTSGTFWGSFNYGTGVWTPAVLGLDRYNIPWDTNLVFSRLVMQCNGTSVQDFKIGKLTVGYQPLKYIVTP